MNPALQKRLEALQGRDPVAVMDALASDLPAALAGARPALLATPEKAGKWSLLQTVRHMADTELIFGERIRRYLADATPAIHPFDENRWAEELRYGEGRLEDSLDLLRALRASNLRLVRGLTPDRLAVVAVHPERGPESLETLLKIVATHDLVHLAQIARIRKTLGA